MSGNRTPCHFIHFGLFVTGKTEHEHIVKLLHILETTKACQVKVIRFIPQRNPVTSAKRKLKMTGTGQNIPPKDVEEIGLPARACLQQGGCRYLILLDDLEHERSEQAYAVFQRYRQALDTILTDEQRPRAAVHFLVNMLEAYFFAHTDAVNTVLDLDPPLTDYAGDVETIRHPKGNLKKLVAAYHEVKHGGEILDLLDVEYVLSRPETCASLRALFAWCMAVLQARYAFPDTLEMPDCRLEDGILSVITGPQLLSLK